MYRKDHSWGAVLMGSGRGTVDAKLQQLFAKINFWCTFVLMKRFFYKLLVKLILHRKDYLRSKANEATAEYIRQVNLFTEEKPNKIDKARLKMNEALDKSAAWNDRILRMDITMQLLQNGQPS